MKNKGLHYTKKLLDPNIHSIGTVHQAAEALTPSTSIPDLQEHSSVDFPAPVVTGTSKGTLWAGPMQGPREHGAS